MDHTGKLVILPGRGRGADQQAKQEKDALHTCTKLALPQAGLADILPDIKRNRTVQQGGNVLPGIHIA